MSISEGLLTRKLRIYSITILRKLLRCRFVACTLWNGTSEIGT